MNHVKPVTAGRKHVQRCLITMDYILHLPESDEQQLRRTMFAKMLELVDEGYMRELIRKELQREQGLGLSWQIQAICRTSAEMSLVLEICSIQEIQHSTLHIRTVHVCTSAEIGAWCIKIVKVTIVRYLSSDTIFLNLAHAKNKQNHLTQVPKFALWAWNETFTAKEMHSRDIRLRVEFPRGDRSFEFNR